MSQWMYATGGEQQGPVTDAELRRLAADGSLKPADLIWREGLKDWVPAGRVKGLFPAQASAPAAPAAFRGTPSPPGFSGGEGRGEGDCGVPLTRPSATLSPHGGERDALLIGVPQNAATPAAAPQPAAPSGPPAPAPKMSVMAIMSILCGVLSVLMALAGGLCCTLGGIPAALVAVTGIVLGLVARKRIARSAGTLGHGGMAIAGLIVGIIALVLSIIVIIMMFLQAGVVMSQWEKIKSGMPSSPTPPSPPSQKVQVQPSPPPQPPPSQKVQVQPSTPPQPPVDDEAKLRKIAAGWQPAGGPIVDLLPTMEGDRRAAKEGDVWVLRSAGIATKQKFPVPADFRFVAKTDSNNIRFGYNADEMIFNWEMNRDEFRIWGGPASMKNKPGAGRVPVNEWVGIELIVWPDEMIVYVDGAERYRTKADFSKVNEPLKIFSMGSTVKVKSVEMTRPAAR